MPNEEADYKVGYGKPPKASQFKHGVSGNPKGRPKGSRNVSTIVASVANRVVTVNEGGRAVKTTLKEAVVLQIGMKAAKGDRHAGREFLNLCRQAEVDEELTGDKPEVSERDAALLKAMSKRFAAYEESNGDGRV